MSLTRVMAVLNRYPGARLMAVTKYASVDQTRHLIDAGVTLLGENKVQDGLAKQAAFVDRPALAWHLIGHLQTNKIKKAVTGFSGIDSVDSLKVLHKIGAESEAIGMTTSVLIQVNMGREPQKTGFLPEELLEFHPQLWAVSGVKIAGLMIVVPASSTVEVIRPYFSDAKKLYDRLKSVYSGVHTLSMGMSSDFEIALQEGSTLVRVGSLLFES